jgi:hypothetical protein
MKIVQVRKSLFLAAGTLAFLITLLTGCLKDVKNTPVTPKTYLSLMHLAPRAPAVEVYFNTTKASSAISSGAVSSSYSALDPDLFSITFKKAGGDSVVASLTADYYDSLKYYTLLLFNTDSTHASAVKIQDDFSVLTTDKAYYRFFHMSPDIGNVDLYFDNTLVQSGRQYADNTNGYFYNQFSAQTPGSPTVYVKKAGTDSVISQLSSVSMSAANAYTIFLKGIPGGTGNNTPGIGVLQAAD